MEGPNAYRHIAAAFQLPGSATRVTPYGQGHINDTYLLLLDSSERYLLQRLNPSVFQDPDGLMENIARVTAHLCHKLEAAGAADIDRRVLTLVPTRSGRWYHRDEAGSVWRIFHFIENTVTFDGPPTPVQVEAAAYRIGEFQGRLADLPGPRLAVTIPRFHDARSRFEAFREALTADVCNRATGARVEIDFLQQRASLVVQWARLQGQLPERITHNDTKLTNLLFDAATGEALCVIDLDTVMPGLVLYDFGDLVRTAAATAPEDTQALGTMALSRPHFEAIARGYLAATSAWLTPDERTSLVFGAKLLPFLMALRFLTDYLAGDRYYKIHRPAHNLDRCRAQCALLASVESQEGALTRLIESMP